MQTTKIIRRIDELGRIVVPKEIRRTLKLRTNDTLEIFSEGDTLILKKYSPYHSEYDTCVCLTAGLKNITKREVIITDTQKVICSSIAGVEGCILSQKTLELSGRSFDSQNEIIQPITERSFDFSSQIILPIFNSELIGYIILFGDEISDYDKRLAELSAEFLALKMG